MTDLLVQTLDTGVQLRLPDGRGSLTLVPRRGQDLPRYHFRLGRVVHAAQELGLFRVQQTLLLSNDHTGDSELTGLWLDDGLDAQERCAAVTALVQGARRWIAEHRDACGDWLILELPGWRTPTGVSPFWEALGARFYPHDWSTAQARWGSAWCSHLAALLPRQTLYLSFLGEAAQQACAQTDAAHAALLPTLHELGFLPPLQVRIDDGGPVLSCPLPRG
ncbi:arginine N-succinyltransferase [Roseateles sp. DB2]|uniref:arginine N-succinyltransferase n=1 Tax=Roseateles sp. DB2 TaxID=3453717 RepID=UPI003EEEC7AB